ISVECGGRSNLSRDPRPLISLHLGQLPLHDIDEPARLFVGAMHRVPLKESRDERAGSNKRENIGSGDEPSGDLYERGFVGFLVIGLGAALLRLSMKLLDKANEAPRLWAAR